MNEERYSALTGGLLLMTAGTLLALHNMGKVDIWSLRQWWPLLLLLPAGKSLVTRSGCMPRWMGALMWVTAAVVMLAHEHGYPVLRFRVLASLALIAGGVYLIWRGPGAPVGKAGAA